MGATANTRRRSVLRLHCRRAVSTMADSEVAHLAKTTVGRRRFLKRAGAGAAAGLAFAPQGVSCGPGGAPKCRSRGSHRTRQAWVGLHAGSDSIPGDRILRGQSRLELSRPARIDPEPRRQQKSGTIDVPARGIVGGHGAWLRQDRRQTDDDHGARHRGPPARFHGDLQRLLRSRSHLHHRGQHFGRELSPRQCRVGA